MNQRPRKLPSAQPADEKARHRLLRAALDSFAEIGYEASSIRGIADRAGVGFQLISYYFGSKEELWLATVQEAYNEAERRYTRTMSNSDDPNERVRDSFRYVIKNNMERPQLRKILVQEFLSGSKRYKDVLRPMILKYFKTVVIPTYERLVADGVIEGYSAGEVALLVGNMTLGNLASIFQAEFMLDTTADNEILVEKEVDLLVRHLTTNRDRRKSGSVAHQRDQKRIATLQEENRRLKELVGSLMLEKTGPSKQSGD